MRRRKILPNNRKFCVAIALYEITRFELEAGLLSLNKIDDLL